MSVATFKFEILMGRVVPRPVSSEFITSLTRIKIIRGDSAPCGFQISLRTQYTSVPGEHKFIADETVRQFNRTMILVSSGLLPSVLIDGYITRFEFSEDGQELFIFGEDLSAKMNLIQVSSSYPLSADGEIVEQVLGRYVSLGMTPEVIPPEVTEAPTDTVPQQLVTDLVYLKFLAERNNSRFYIKPGPLPGDNKAYWGPQEIELPYQPALTAPSAPLTNVTSMTPSFEAPKRRITYGERLAEGEEGAESADLPASATSYSIMRKMARKQPPLTDFSTIALDPDSFSELLQLLEVSGSLVKDERLTSAQAIESAQGSTDRSTARTARITGELDSQIYGHVIEAPGYIVVRGLGQSFDGNYYVEEVTHDVAISSSGTSYKQKFNLSREGLGTTTETTLL